MPASTPPPRPRSRTLALIATTALAVVLAAALVASYLPENRSSSGDGVVRIGPSPTFALDSLTGSAPAGGSLDGHSLPDLTLATLTGTSEKRIRLADAARGQPAVINLWWSGCVPCQRETPGLVGLWRELQASNAGVAFVGIDVQDTPADGMAFLRRFGGTGAYPMLSDPSASAAYRLGTSTLPTTLLVDASGHVVASRFGEVTPETLRTLLREHFGIAR